jgi:hypothetical protein
MAYRERELCVLQGFQRQPGGVDIQLPTADDVWAVFVG